MDKEQSHAYAKLFSRFPRVSTDVSVLVGSEECISAYWSAETHQLTDLEVLELDFVVCLHNQKELHKLIRYAKSLKTLLIWNIDIKDFFGTRNEVNYIKFVLAHFQHLRVISREPDQIILECISDHESVTGSSQTITRKRMMRIQDVLY
ncbi:hypothetical protein POM88_034070 [Heracleum sosnowskyi]|uniref:Uncharacterized protein n=1 Tax=Heracleum sosnowskyi TaxID=360622 RepID=A0AAD8HKL2_9APIA|nr:hypothetical protein POM88_034070 [Heracleum sosnowskyi]